MFLDPPSGHGNPLVCNVGDWIVRNARGDVFPMTVEKFSETYEPSGQADVAAAIARGEWVPGPGLSPLRADDAPCSFCGKPPREVKHLVASTSARICDECLAGAREIEAKEPFWRPIEQVPVDKAVLMYCEHGPVEVGHYNSLLQKCVSGWDHRVFPNVTHWAPLPEVPK